MESGRRLTVRTIPIVRMDCSTCITVLENEVKKLNGVKEARGNYMTKTVRVTYDPEVVGLLQIEAAIERIGYQIAYKKYLGVVSRLKGLVRKKKPDDVRTVSDSDFPGKILHASRPVAVLFSSPNCPVCQVFRPTYAEAARDIEERAEFFEMDVSSSETWRRYGIITVPTVLVFQDGQVKDRLTSLPGKDEIEKALNA